MSQLVEPTHNKVDWGLLVRYGLAGGASAVVYLGLGLGLVWLRIDLVIAHGAAFAAGLAVSYLGQKYFTYRLRGDHRRFGSRFIIATAALAIVAAGLTIALRWMGLRPDLVIIANTLSYPVLSFLVHNSWTFKAERTQ